MDKPKRIIKKLPKIVRDISFRPNRFPKDNEINYLEEKMGTFSYNNSMLVYVNGIGEVYSIPLRFSSGDTEDAMTLELSDRMKDNYGADGEKIPQMLKESGYQNGYMFVPHSNDGGHWGSELFRDAKIIPRIKRQFEMEKLYARLDVEPKLDVPENLAKNFRPAWENFDDFGHWVKNIGKFSSNNGVISFVDKYAIPHVAPYEEELPKALRKVGFKCEAVFVPHSNDGGHWLNYMFPRELERIESKYQKERLEAVRNEAGIVIQE